ncbi:hypothetical protein L1765_04865 [Microaerobacter geothermalis]|uniref:hypothetical protein n=1 Tax=Microaerobacter geothermalis TaxID=674972 RepID=UPI001F391C62|nr:hypothetical protein [Microaerobacter geothermalis]MCF6093327.1 hypothetical protein [Microaerobacter geothermalis]
MSQNGNLKNIKKEPDILRLLRNKNLEIVAAALLISGELKVDNITLSREGEVTLELIGKFKKVDNKQVMELYNFLKKNGDMTMDDVFEAFKRRMED